jgi:hypothetical protein
MKGFVILIGIGVFPLIKTLTDPSSTPFPIDKGITSNKKILLISLESSPFSFAA